MMDYDGMFWREHGGERFGMPYAIYGWQVLSNRSKRTYMLETPENAGHLYETKDDGP